MASVSACLALAPGEDVFGLHDSVGNEDNGDVGVPGQVVALGPFRFECGQIVWPNFSGRRTALPVWASLPRCSGRSRNWPGPFALCWAVAESRRLISRVNGSLSPRAKTITTGHSPVLAEDAGRLAGSRPRDIPLRHEGARQFLSDRSADWRRSAAAETTTSTSTRHAVLPGRRFIGYLGKKGQSNRKPVASSFTLSW